MTSPPNDGATTTAAAVTAAGERETELRAKHICRMCLDTESPLSDVFSKENRQNSRCPLPIQIMAISSLEVSAAFEYRSS